MKSRVMEDLRRVLRCVMPMHLQEHNPVVPCLNLVVNRRFQPKCGLLDEQGTLIRGHRIDAAESITVFRSNLRADSAILVAEH